MQRGSANEFFKGLNGLTSQIFVLYLSQSNHVRNGFSSPTMRYT
jgi:hypothetical protein